MVPRHIREASAALMLLVLMAAAPVVGDISSVAHDYNRFPVSNSRLFCRVCHGGVIDRVDVDVEFPVLEYRCIACHYGVNSLMVNLVKQSPHSDTGCLGCHIVYHSGHRSYSTSTPGQYGCRGPHRIVTHDIDPPPDASVYFVTTWLSNDTGIFPRYYLWKRIFYTSSPISNMIITVDAYMNPYTGSFADIPSNKRYWICFECHFTVKTDATAWPTATATYFGAHTDRCAACHSNYYGDTTLEPHGIPEAGTQDSSKWWYDNCGRCHTGVYEGVANSVHSSIGCRCHTQLHISRYNETGSWAFLYKPVVTGPIDKPVTLETVSIFYSETTNSTGYGAPVHPVSYNAEYSYLSQFYAGIEGNATFITETSKYLICLNCHFITDDPLTAASMGPVNGKIPIYIPSDNISIDPHTITEDMFQTGITEGVEGSNLLAALLIVSLVIAGITLALLYKVLRRTQ